VAYSDGLTSRSKSFQFSASLLKSGIGLQRQAAARSSVESSLLGSSTASCAAVPQTSCVVPPSDDSIGTSTELLDQALRLVHDCSDRLFVGFRDATFRHTCRPEHRWFVASHRVSGRAQSDVTELTWFSF